ncbi:hypothetical protein N7471_009264 [Penicillium samsonianum]|uniref:uncharacterized protein n=1 Tax=Penicillium samsonianum TaxID=1882272 RepID=UPI0025468020|nr:uncharacterized protein N7471_009264 [Penicillium samsonianum]KAJ6128047.1 hypothetical protein N7471_009264 [Penicillium samsonianum]
MVPSIEEVINYIWHIQCIRHVKRTKTPRKTKGRKQDLSFSASAVAFPTNAELGTQRTIDRLILNFTTFLTANSLFWNILIILFFSDL